MEFLDKRFFYNSWQAIQTENAPNKILHSNGSERTGQALILHLKFRLPKNCGERVDAEDEDVVIKG
jgi:hypothetical protein